MNIKVFERDFFAANIMTLIIQTFKRYLNLLIWVKADNTFIPELYLSYF